MTMTRIKGGKRIALSAKEIAELEAEREARKQRNLQEENARQLAEEAAVTLRAGTPRQDATNEAILILVRQLDALLISSGREPTGDFLSLRNAVRDLDRRKRLQN